MSVKFRRLIRLFLFGLFLLSAPIIILYSLGYRLTTSRSIPTPIGVALLESKPRGARVTVNGQAYGTTPESVPNLPAGDILFHLELDGYRAWQKRLPIRAGFATEARNIILFPSNPVRETLARDIDHFSLSPNRQLHVYSNGSQVGILDQNGDPVAQAQLSIGQPNSLLWSPSSQQVLISDQKNNYALLNVNHPTTLTPLAQLQGASDIVWDPRIAGRLLYLSDLDHLIAYHPLANTSEVVSRNVSAFATSNRHLYSVDISGQLIRTSLTGQPAPLKNLDLPLPIQNLTVAPNGNLALTLEDGSLWLVSDDLGEPIKIANNYQSAAFSPDNQMLAVATDNHSLHVINISDERSPLAIGRLELVTRLSTTIKDLQWFAGGRHLIFTTNDEIRIIEIDIRDHPVSFQVDTTNLGNPRTTVGDDGDIVYYLKNTGTSQDLVATHLLVDQ